MPDSPSICVKTSQNTNKVFVYAVSYHLLQRLFYWQITYPVQSSAYIWLLSMYVEGVLRQSCMLSCVTTV